MSRDLTPDPTGPRRSPVTLVCVYNDDRVLEGCLLSSVRAGLPEAPDTEVIAVDNRAGAFASAGAALNHGVRRARHEVVAFVHQDVYLHSLPHLELAAGLLLDGRVDVAGATGVTADGRLAGRVRDRVIMAGDTAVEPVDVDSLDEVLFMAARERLLTEPLAEDPELAWHAYAVEYGLRTRRLGGRVAAVDVPLTHNSLSTNLAKLDLAHATVGERYPERLPLRTTCGVVGGRKVVLPGPLDVHRWRYRWVRDSLTTAPWHGLRERRPVVLSDLRESIDDLLACAPDARPVAVLNVLGEQDRRGTWTDGPEVGLLRRDRPITVSLAEAGAVLPRVQASPDQSFVVTNLGLHEAKDLVDSAPGAAFAGFSEGTGAWGVFGPLALSRHPAFREARSRPLHIGLAAARADGSPSRATA